MISFVFTKEVGGGKTCVYLVILFEYINIAKDIPQDENMFP